MDLFEEEVSKCSDIINKNKENLLIMVNTILEEQGAKVHNTIEQTRLLTEKVSSHAIQLAEHDSSVRLNTGKIQILQDEV